MNGLARSTNIGPVYVNTVGTASIAHFGDNGTTRLLSRVIAVQRAVTRFDHDETRFASYELFARPLLELDTGLNVAFSKQDCVPEIRIERLNVIALASSSLLRAGVGGPFEAESRIKDIRQYNFLDIR